MLYVCPQGCETDVGMSKPRPTTCEKHGSTYRYTKALKSTTDLKPKSDQRQAEEESGARPKRSKGLKRTQRRETAAEKKARLNFNAKVKARKCWFAWHRPCERCEGGGEVAVPLLAGGVDYGPSFIDCPVCEGDGKHRCTKPKDAHHLVPQRFTRKMFLGVLPEADFVAILHNPLIGAPLCRKAHDAIEAKRDRIYFEDLTPECIEYVSSLPDFVLIELERQCPKRPQLQPSPTNKGSVVAPETEHV